MLNKRKDRDLTPTSSSGARKSQANRGTKQEDTLKLEGTRPSSLRELIEEGSQSNRSGRGIRGAITRKVAAIGGPSKSGELATFNYRHS
jgi:hypothetical protein